jgi:hypothetical protein
VLFDPWVKNQYPDPGSGMNIPDLISRALKQYFGLKIFKFFDADAGSGSGMEKFGSGILDQHSGSTLTVVIMGHGPVLRSSLSINLLFI